MTQAHIKSQIEASIAVKQALLSDIAFLGQVQQLAEICLKSLRASGKIIFAGNGGSFADAQHLSAEFTSRFMFDRAPLASMVLGANSSAISAMSNDYGYKFVFARELEALAQPNDVFIAISTSGKSPNILEAVKVAKASGVATFAWTGATGGSLYDVCECLCVPSINTARIQECHILVGHILCGLVESWYFQKEI